MEQYLIDEYDVREDLEWLKTTDQIKDYFSSLVYEELECGQGYYEESGTWICKISNEFYQVYVSVDVDSARQDRGDRLYWIDKVNEVTFEKIDKPLPKPKKEYQFTFILTDSQFRKLNEFIKENKMEVK